MKHITENSAGGEKRAHVIQILIKQTQYVEHSGRESGERDGSCPWQFFRSVFSIFSLCTITQLTPPVCVFLVSVSGNVHWI